MSQPKLRLLRVESKASSRIRFLSSTDTNKGYWRIFLFFLPFGVLLMRTSNIFGVKMRSFLKKISKYSKCVFFGSDKLENVCWVIEKCACVHKTSQKIFNHCGN